MKKSVLLMFIAAFVMTASACEQKSTDEQLKENTAKEAELLKKSASEKAEKVGNTIEKGINELTK